MANPADTLKDMVDSAASDAADVQTSINSVDDQIADLQEKQAALEYTMSSSCDDLENDLLPDKGDMVHTYGDFGVSNATDWYVADIDLDNTDTTSTNNVTYISSTQFTCDGNQTTKFPSGETILFDEGGTTSHTTITISEYDTTSYIGLTLVTVDDAVIPSGVEKVGVLTYEYNGVGWDSDSEIQSRIDEFDFAYDYKTQPVGLGGTYGTEDMIAKLSGAKGLLTSNRDKLADSETKLARHAS